MAIQPEVTWWLQYGSRGSSHRTATAAVPCVAEPAADHRVHLGNSAVHQVITGTSAILACQHPVCLGLEGCAAVGGLGYRTGWTCCLTVKASSV